MTWDAAECGVEQRIPAEGLAGRGGAGIPIHRIESAGGSPRLRSAAFRGLLTLFGSASRGGSAASGLPNNPQGGLPGVGGVQAAVAAPRGREGDVDVPTALAQCSGLVRKKQNNVSPCGKALTYAFVLSHRIPGTPICIGIRRGGLSTPATTATGGPAPPRLPEGAAN